MDELGLFTLALGLSKPWQVVDLKFSKKDGRLDLWIDFVKGSKFPCPCGETAEADVHDTLERTWRHLNFFQYETHLHARVPRIRCGSCGVKQVEVPWAVNVKYFSHPCGKDISQERGKDISHPCGKQISHSSRD